MSIALSAEELINLAIDIERRGVAFYDTMARSTGNEAVSTIFKLLVKMERQHVNLFENMLTDMGQSAPLDGYTSEHAAYLESLAENAVFTDDAATSDMVDKMEKDVEALEMAIGAEKDSVLFYYEMRDIMPPPSRSAINNVIAEEKTHLSQLTRLKKELGK